MKSPSELEALEQEYAAALLDFQEKEKVWKEVEATFFKAHEGELKAVLEARDRYKNADWRLRELMVQMRDDEDEKDAKDNQTTP